MKLKLFLYNLFKNNKNISNKLFNTHMFLTQMLFSSLFLIMDNEITLNFIIGTSSQFLLLNLLFHFILGPIIGMATCVLPILWHHLDIEKRFSFKSYEYLFMPIYGYLFSVFVAFKVISICCSNKNPIIQLLSYTKNKLNKDLSISHSVKNSIIYNKLEEKESKILK